MAGDNPDRVPDFVAQFIYKLDRPGIPLYVGQQVDVFIKPDEPEQKTARVVAEMNQLN